MKKVVLIIAIIGILTGISVLAQKKQPGVALTPKQSQLVCIQDDAGEGYMVFDLVTGAYKYRLCEYGALYTGVGAAKTDGCMTTFSAAGAGYAITASADLCGQQAKCIIDMISPYGGGAPYQEVLSDGNLRDSVDTCNAIKPPSVDLPAEVILQSDADGSYLCIYPSIGSYKFVHCEDGAVMSGTGNVRWDGVWVNFGIIAPEYRILASANPDANMGKAAIEVFLPISGMAPMKEYISDNNLKDNTTVCGAKF